MPEATHTPSAGEAAPSPPPSRPPLQVSAQDYEARNPIAAGDRVTRGRHWEAQTAAAAALPASHLGTVLGPGGHNDGTAKDGPSGGKPSWRIKWDCGMVRGHVYGDGVYTVAVLKVADGAPGVYVAEVVGKIAWTRDPSVAFAEQVAAGDRPCILRNTAASDWPAMGAAGWTDEGLLERLQNGDTPLAGVKINRQAGKPFHYFHHAAMNAVPSMAAEYKQATFTKHSMTFAEFQQRVAMQRADERTRMAAAAARGHCEAQAAGNCAGNAPAPASPAGNNAQDAAPSSGPGQPPPAHVPGMEYCWAGKLDDWGKALLAEVVPLDPLMVLSPGFDPHNEHLFRETFVWLSPSGTVTPTHYDVSHNFFVQLHGRKRVLLFPPQSWQQLYLQPVLHPGALSTQIDIGNITAATRQTFPHFAKEHVFAVQADLEPGDVLYIPPLWLHHVTTLNDSVSLSVWSPYLASEKYEDAIANAALPIKAHWPKQHQVAALRMLLESLVASLKLPGDVTLSGFVHWALLDNRYARLFSGGPVGGAGLSPDAEFCWNRQHEDELLLDGEEIFAAGLRKTVGVFRDIAKVAGPARRDIYLANFIELAVSTIVGVARVPMFLHALVHC